MNYQWKVFEITKTNRGRKKSVLVIDDDGVLSYCICTDQDAFEYACSEGAQGFFMCELKKHPDSRYRALYRFLSRKKA